MKPCFFASWRDAIWQTLLVALGLFLLTALAVGYIEEVNWNLRPAVALEGPDEIPVQVK